MSTECSAAVLCACEAAWQETSSTCFMEHGRSGMPSSDAETANVDQRECFHAANISRCLLCHGSAIPEDVCDQRPAQIVDSGHIESVSQRLLLVNPQLTCQQYCLHFQGALLHLSQRGSGRTYDRARIGDAMCCDVATCLFVGHNA